MGNESAIDSQQIEDLKGLHLAGTAKPVYHDSYATLADIRHQNDNLELPLTENQLISKLTPSRATELIDEIETGIRFPESLNQLHSYRVKAQELAISISQADKPEEIPRISELVDGSEIGKIEDQGNSFEIIRQKLGLISLHKIIELISHNGAKISTEYADLLPNSVKEYFTIVTSIHNFKTLGLEANFDGRSFFTDDSDWAKNSEAISYVTELEKNNPQTTELMKTFKNIQELAHYQQIWDKEGLDGSKLYGLSKPDTTDLVKNMIKYMTWVTQVGLLENKDLVGAKEDFSQWTKSLVNAERPDYIGKYMDIEDRDEITQLIKVAEQSIFGK